MDVSYEGMGRGAARWTRFSFDTVGGSRSTHFSLGLFLFHLLQSIDRSLEVFVPTHHHGHRVSQSFDLGWNERVLCIAPWFSSHVTPYPLPVSSTWVVLDRFPSSLFSLVLFSFVNPSLPSFFHGTSSNCQKDGLLVGRLFPTPTSPVVLVHPFQSTTHATPSITRRKRGAKKKKNATQRNEDAVRVANARSLLRVRRR